MREWLINNGVWAIGLIFIGGTLYSQVESNTRTLTRQAEDYRKIDLLEAQVNTNTLALQQLSKEAVGQYKEFLGKLDQVIMQLDARDAQRQMDIGLLSREVYEMKGKSYSK
jgi:hypothetical protein